MQIKQWCFFSVTRKDNPNITLFFVAERYSAERACLRATPIVVLPVSFQLWARF